MDAEDWPNAGDVVQKKPTIAKEDVGGVGRAVVGEVHIFQGAVHAVQMHTAPLCFGVVVGEHCVDQRQCSGWIAVDRRPVLGVVVFQGAVCDVQVGLRMRAAKGDRAADRVGIARPYGQVAEAAAAKRAQTSALIGGTGGHDHVFAREIRAGGHSNPSTLGRLVFTELHGTKRPGRGGGQLQTAAVSIRPTVLDRTFLKAHAALDPQASCLGSMAMPPCAVGGVQSATVVAPRSAAAGLGDASFDGGVDQTNVAGDCRHATPKRGPAIDQCAVLQFCPTTEHTHATPKGAVASFEVAVLCRHRASSHAKPTTFIGPTMLDGESLNCHVTRIWSHPKNAMCGMTKVERWTQTVAATIEHGDFGAVRRDEHDVVIGKFQSFVVRP